MAAHIAECLNATLSPDQNTRVAAELKLNELLASPETGLALAELVLTQNADVSLRQISTKSNNTKCRVLISISSDQHSASIILRKYVKERWSPFYQAFKGSAPPVEIKAQIRQAVFRGLSDPIRKIRSSCAHTLSSIANCDWPDEYPDLLTSLIELLSSTSTDSVHGAMQVFTEFIKTDLTEDQILPVLRQLLPVLLNILGSTETHSPLTRSRTIAVFRECVTALFMVKDQHPQGTKEAVSTVLPTWLDAFKVLLSIDVQQDLANAQNWDALAIRIEVFKTLDVIHVSFPKSLTPYLSDFLAQSLYHLQALQPTFKTYYLDGTESAPPSSEDEPIELVQLLCPIVDFTAAIIRSGKAKTWLTNDNLNALVAGVFHLVQMTNDDEEQWANNANAFVAQEDDETQPYSVRVAVFDLLASLIDRSPAHSTKAFHNALQQVLIVSKQAQEAGQEDWWRPLEAALAAVGSQSETIRETIEDEEDSGREKPLDIEYLLSQVIPNILGLSDCPFLQGRGFVFASQFSSLLPAALAGQYLDASVQVIEAEQAGIPVKISAVKAVSNFCGNAKDELLINYAPRIANNLRPFLAVTSEDTLALVLGALSQVLDIEKGTWITKEFAESLVLSLLEVWTKNNQDPIFLTMVNEIFITLASSKASGIYETVVQKSIPPLSQTIATSTRQDSWLAGTAIDIVNSIIEGAPDSGIGDGLFAHIAPSLFKCLMDAEDRDTLQHGISCLTTIVRKDVNQLLSWNDGNGSSGLDYTLKLIAKVLESQDESGGLVIGELIIHLFRRAGDSIMPVLPQLLQAMIARMLTAATATFTQSLVIPFAFLINNQRDTVLNLLESIEVEGRSGLDILIQTWCENAETFQGFWAQRISVLGLTQLFTANTPSLQSLTVKGEMIVNETNKNVIMTRSRTKTTPHQFTQISFALKALKLIVHELQSGGDSATIGVQNAGVPYSEYNSDDDEEWTEEEKQNQGFKQDELSFLSDLIGPKGIAFDNDDYLNDTDDDDLKNDPVSQMDMQGHLVNFIRECASQNASHFQDLAGGLNIEEGIVVQKVLQG